MLKTLNKVNSRVNSNPYLKGAIELIGVIVLFSSLYISIIFYGVMFNIL